MEYLKVNVVDKSQSGGDQFKHSRPRNQKAMVSNIVDVIAKINGVNVVYHTDGDGTKKMKILMKKEDLKQVMEMIRNGSASGKSTSSSSSSMSMTLEHRLSIMRKRHALRANQSKLRNVTSWRPILQTIPE